MEKILLSNNETMDIHGISNTGDVLEINFVGVNIVELEEIFENKAALEKIILKDAEGNAMAAFKNYSIFSQIAKIKNVMINEITEETADITTVTLEKEADYLVAIRQMQSMYDGAIMDLGTTVSELAEGGVV